MSINNLNMAKDLHASIVKAADVGDDILAQAQTDALKDFALMIALEQDKYAESIIKLALSTDDIKFRRYYA